MQVQRVMSSPAEYVSSNTSLAEAAMIMRDSNIGVLPIGDAGDEKLKGIITDRDIVVRAVADHHNPDETTVGDVKTNKVLYCFQGDPVEKAAQSMRENQVYRLVVLDDRDNMRIRGIVSLNDIVDHDKEQLGGETARGISS